MGYMAPPVPVIDWPARNCVNSIEHGRAPDGGQKQDGDMTQITPLEKLRVPLGGQEIELQQVDFDTGGMSFLRTRIREKSRFTIFDIDPATAEAWGRALLDWAGKQARDTETP
jgi:hypothetical protein